MTYLAIGLAIAIIAVLYFFEWIAGNLENDDA